MSDAKVQTTHLRREAFVYVRQSSAAQVAHHRESTRRQYDLAARARELGWPADQITVIDEDLGLSGATTQGRGGFARMTAQVALGRVGIVLGLEVSRLARNNADWYRLLDLCGMTDTLIGDADGLYHPSFFNDRLVLGLKGTMSEAELHILRARLDGGIRNKAARGELRRGLPVGLVWGERDGEILLHPDEAVTGAIRAVFERFAEFGSVRRVWLWFRAEGLTFPLRLNYGAIRWVPPSYHAIHQVLTNPAYAGAYTFGRSRQERHVDEDGVVRKRVRRLPRSSGRLLITEHHRRYIDWSTYRRNLAAERHDGAAAACGGGCRQRRKRTAAGHRHVRTLRTATAYPLPRTAGVARLSLPREGPRAGKRRVLPEHGRRAGRPSRLRGPPRGDAAGWPPGRVARRRADRSRPRRRSRTVAFGRRASRLRSDRAERRYRAVEPEIVSWHAASRPNGSSV